MGNSIKLKNYLNIMEEIAAGGDITPGHLVSLTSSDTVVVHPTTAGPALIMFAVEDELQGKGIDDAFASGDKVQVWIPQRGDQVLAIIPDGSNIAIGDLLESAGDGQLQEHTVGSTGSPEYPISIIGVALEAKDLSDTSGAESSGPLGYDKRLKIRIV